MVHAVGEPDQVERGQHLRAALRCAERQEEQGQLDVFIGIENGEQMIN